MRSAAGTNQASARVRHSDASMCKAAPPSRNHNTGESQRNTAHERRRKVLSPRRINKLQRSYRH
ncbi:hypothetical protein MTP06_20560 [Streptomyces sp. PLM4]|nr:hypothetical protein MTP06_20560 [Streptomyces sp. PLM4]